MGTMENSLNYIKYFETMVGDNHPSLETTLNRPLHELVSLFETGSADTQVRRLNLKITDSTLIGASVVDNDIVYFNNVSGKFEPANDSRALGMIDINQLVIYNAGVYKTNTFNSLVVNERYHIDKTNPGKLVLSTDANASDTSIGLALSEDTFVLALSNSKYLQQHLENTNNPHQVTKEQIGLDKVNNTSDMDKPISHAVAQVLDTITTAYRHVYVSDDYQSLSGDDISVDTTVAIAQVDKVDSFVLQDDTDYKITINDTDYTYTTPVPVAQINKITIITATENDVYAVNVDDTVYSYTAENGDTVSDIAQNLAAKISNGEQDDDEIIITAETAGVPQTVSVDGSSTDATSLSESAVRANVSSDTAREIINGFVGVIGDDNVSAVNDSDTSLHLVAKEAGVAFTATVDTSLMNILNIIKNKDKPVSITLPDSPIENSNIHILDAKGTFKLDNLTILRNNTTIMGLEEDMVVDTANASFSLVYVDNDWRVK